MPRVGAMNDRTGDFITVLAGEHTIHHVSNSPEVRFGLHRTAWHGDVFFDHVRGVIDASPVPLVESRPYLLVAYYQDFDWTQQHTTTVTEYASAADLLAEAQGLVSNERASGASNKELWEVYGVRIRERRPRVRRPRLVDGLEERLLEDIRNAPDDDGPRLVWADAIGGERGELVVIQVDLERGGLSQREVIARKKRQRDLLGRHGAMWSGLDGIARRVSFRRGFVDAAEIAAEAFLDHADDIVETAPMLTSLNVFDLRADGPASDPIPLLSKLLADPATAGLSGLDLSCDTARTVDDRRPGELALEQVVRSNMLRQLRALGSRDVIGMHGVRTLANPRSLHELERLWLRGITDLDAMRTLLSVGLPTLRSFDLGSHDAAAGFLPPSVTEVFGRLGEAGLAALASSPAAPRVEHVEIKATLQDLTRFGAFPQLRSLCTVQPFVPPDGSRDDRRVLAASPLGALRELAISDAVSERHARMIAEVLGPQLELLDLRNSHAALRYLNDLKSQIAGELLVGRADVTRGLLRVGPMTQHPWWDHVALG